VLVELNTFWTSGLKHNFENNIEKTFCSVEYLIKGQWHPQEYVLEVLRVNSNPHLTIKLQKVNRIIASCLHRASMIIKHFISHIMHHILYVDTIKIIKYLKVLQHVSDHKGSIIREPCTVLG